MEADEFVRWWEKCVQPDLRKILRRYFTSSDAVKDIEQELAYIAWKKRTDFSSIEHFGGWLMKRARGLALDNLRASHRAKEVFLQMIQEDELKSSPAQEHVVALREISEAVKLLPPRQGAVIRGMFEGKTDSKLASELETNEATVRSLRRFGRAGLLSLLKETTKNDK